MKCQLYTYNTKPAQYYRLPSFKQRLNWGTESGKWLASGFTVAAVASMFQVFPNDLRVKLNKLNNENKGKRDSGEWIPEFLQQCPNYIQDLVKHKSESFKDRYKGTTNPNILEQYTQFYSYAIKHGEMGAWAAIDGNSYMDFIYSEEVISSLDILGMKNLKAALELGQIEFVDFCKAVYTMKKFLTKDNLELLKSKINPENTNQYRNLQKGISKDKKEINKLLGRDARKKRKELEKEIDALKSDKSNYKQIKELKSQIQNLYKNSENSDKIRELMQNINEKKLELKKLQNQKVELTPEEIVKKLKTFDMFIRLAHSYLWVNFNTDNCDEDFRNKLKNYEDSILYDVVNGNFCFADKELDAVFSKDEINTLYSLPFEIIADEATVKNNYNIITHVIDSLSKKDDKEWCAVLDKLIFFTLGFMEDAEVRKVSEISDLKNCDYLDDLILSLDDEAFVAGLYLFIEAILKSDYSNVQDIMDNLKNNIETKKMFEENGADYNRWAHYDKDSFIEQNVTITAEAARQKAVKNLCDELTNTTYMSRIPQKELDSLFKRLGKIGVQVDRVQKTVKINGRDIVFEDLELIINEMLAETEENDFWNAEHEDKAIDAAIDLAVNHFIQRSDEVFNAQMLKKSENVDIKVRKVDMNDIKYALCLGNHSHCCTALGAHINEWTAPNYILAKCISAIEVISDDKPVGNTMIYLAHVNGELALVLDDIELQIKYQNSDKIRDMIIEYAKKLCEEIGKPDIPIYANGGAIHKVDMSPYKFVPAEISILGKTFLREMNNDPVIVYLDYDQDGHEIGNGEIIESDMYRVA